MKHFDNKMKHFWRENKMKQFGNKMKQFWSEI